MLLFQRAGSCWLPSSLTHDLQCCVCPSSSPPTNSGDFNQQLTHTRRTGGSESERKWAGTEEGCWKHPEMDGGHRKGQTCWIWRRAKERHERCKGIHSFRFVNSQPSLERNTEKKEKVTGRGPGSGMQKDNKRERDGVIGWKMKDKECWGHSEVACFTAPCFLYSPAERRDPLGPLYSLCTSFISDAFFKNTHPHWAASVYNTTCICFTASLTDKHSRSSHQLRVFTDLYGSF